MKLKHLYILGVVALMNAGCNEDSFLDLKPQGSLSEAIMTSTEGADLLVNAAYAALGGPEGQSWSVWCHPTSNWTYGEVRSDNAYKGGGGVGDLNEVHRMETFDMDATNGFLDSKWYHLYCSVQRCNSALRVLNSATDEQVSGRASRIAEMKVLRAHYYFELSRLFNKIPYFDENVELTRYPDIPNNEFTRDEILGKLAKEMLDAAEQLPESQSEVGRIHKYIALAYAAKIKLYRAYQQDEASHAVTSINKDLLKEVVSLCDRVTASNRYGLLNDFQGLDLVANENGKESVFAIQYSMNDGTENAGRINWSNLLNSPGGGSPYGGDGFFLPSQDLINAYQTDAAGLPDFNYQSKADYSWAVLNNGVYTLENTTSNVDPRLDFVVGRPNITWKTYSEEPCGGWVRDKETYGYNCAKRFWVSPESSDMFNGWPWGASQLNWQIIRYADILLWKAEALIELNEGDGLEVARGLINQIRNRARNSVYVKDFNDRSKNAANYLVNPYPADGWSQEYARQALRREVRLEKALEGERFFDLVRWGIAETVMNKYIAMEADKRIYYANAHFSGGKDEYYPVPNNQYGFSGGKYVQNPGYAPFN
ncbi:RagB/SusD family nutrient uptake outer membrane protein [Bacteroides heparinolyticus]|uniref:RagB/SusD family nutrient uptake outer membrane protein n=1 Tax=Prevotella heparinolytica TaxID=28113 RepID=UPI0023F0A4F2|nr:RagB/SusD family nutrient uptake outer membrane protein [Bacteroides heparinolyticus]MCI6213296.1 RagB/SusD family nutrient uptake outer membrane protein [Bacteroides heparinolyticus]